MNVCIVMPRMGLTTGEMPHLRWPPKNWMPGQNLYYLYSACKGLGHDVSVVDANWSRDPVGRILARRPHKVLITTATPTFDGTLQIIAALKARGFAGEIHVGGPHVSLNAGKRDYLLPALDGVQFHPLVGSASTFEWVEQVFPGRSQLEVLAGHTKSSAERFLRDSWQRDTGRVPKDKDLGKYLFRYFAPTTEWMRDTYSGDHIREDMREVSLRHSIITSIGCSKTCSFCGNPYIYRIGFKHEEAVRSSVRSYKAQGIDRISIHDMFFIMSLPHAKRIMQVMREESMAFSMQTCLENLSTELLAELKAYGLKKFLVGIENPVSYSVGKTVELQKVRWLLDTVEALGIEGVKLSYIVGLPGVSLASDLALLDHITREVVRRKHPLEDLQVNLYTPYRPEGDSDYEPYGASERSRAAFWGKARATEGSGACRWRIYLLDQIPYRYWGSFPVAAARAEDLRSQMVLCDIIYDVVYADFRQAYLAQRDDYMAQVSRFYPELEAELPSFEQSRRIYHRLGRSNALAMAKGNDRGRGRRPLPLVS